MKSIVLCLATIVLVAAGCTKNNSAATTGRDAFVGNYHMHDSAIDITCQGCGGGNTYDTTSLNYDMQVLAVPGTSDKAVFNNIGGSGSDTATISGSLATFTGSNYSYASSATLSGSTLTMTRNTYSGTSVYSKSTGTKF